MMKVHIDVQKLKTILRSYAFIVSFHILVLSIIAIHIFWPEKGRVAYIHPCQGQYCVYVSNVAWNDLQVSKPMPLSEAAKLTEELNQAMTGKWATK